MDRQLSVHFRLDEFLRSRHYPAIAARMRPTQREIYRLRLLCHTVLEPIREYVDRPITITSGFRSLELNSKLRGSSRTSQHLYGEAADLVIAGCDLLDVFGFAVRLPNAYQRILYLTSTTVARPRFMHLSIVPSAVDKVPLLALKHSGRYIPCTVDGWLEKYREICRHS